MRVAVLGAPGPAARSERVASGGRGSETIVVTVDMWTSVVTTEKYCK